MSGLFSTRAWNKIWIYRGTFLLGLSNTLKTAIIALMLALAIVLSLITPFQRLLPFGG